jgi:hypothetical protein
MSKLQSRHFVPGSENLWRGDVVGRGKAGIPGSGGASPYLRQALLTVPPGQKAFAHRRASHQVSAYGGETLG